MGQQRADYLIPQRWKRFVFRRGYIPMGDVRDILAHMRPRLDEADQKIFKQHLSHVQNTGTPEFREALEWVRKDRLNAFFKILGDETVDQWDRIVDRRASNFAYGIVVNFLFVILGFVLGRL
jgi:hypothetical protein